MTDFLDNKRELFTGKGTQVKNWVIKEENLSSDTKKHISAAVGSHTVEKFTRKTSFMWK